MAQTVRDFEIGRPSVPERFPGRVWAGTLEDLGGRVLFEGDAIEVESFLFSVTQPVPEQTASPLGVSVDEFGQYVVEDIVGGAYGVGGTPQAAFRDYFVALDDRLSRLRQNRDALHTRLARQLRELEALFPGR